MKIVCGILIIFCICVGLVDAFACGGPCSPQTCDLGTDWWVGNAAFGVRYSETVAQDFNLCSYSSLGPFAGSDKQLVVLSMYQGTKSCDVTNAQITYGNLAGDPMQPFNEFDPTDCSED